MHKVDTKHDNSSLQEKLQKIYARRTGSCVNWDQAEYIKLLERLGNPQNNLPPVIHVAGTNGKGSIIAMLRAIFEAGGYTAHAYTSPHLWHMNERISLAGKSISDEDLERRIDVILSAAGDAPLSFFELATALAFKAFAEKPADILLLEVGMGGRLDCTNVIEKPLVSVINRISMDHMEFLGDRLEKIAAEKAGIMKEGVPCVVGFQGKNEHLVYGVLESTADEVGAKILAHGRDWKLEKQGEARMCFSHGQEHIDLPLPALAGMHQLYNAGVALMALKTIEADFPLSPAQIRKGLENVTWRGRLQRLPQGEYGMPPGWELWLDSGHNDSAGEVLAAQAVLWAGQDQKPLHLVLGMLGTKDVQRFLSPLLPHIASLSLVPIESEPSCLTLDGLKKAVADRPRQTQDHENLRQALSSLQKRGKEPARILITGSVYLAGAVLKEFSSA